MKIDPAFVETNIERLHKSARLLASRVSGMHEDEFISYPVVLKRGTRLCKLIVGFPEADSDYLTPFVLIASFCLELCIKLICFYETSEWLKGHNLGDLYSHLSESTKNDLIENFNKLVKNSKLHKDLARILNNEAKIQFSWNFEKLIGQSSNAFDDWRYAFEDSKNVGCFAGYGEMKDVFDLQIKKLRKC